MFTFLLDSGFTHPLELSASTYEQIDENRLETWFQTARPAPPPLAFAITPQPNVKREFRQINRKNWISQFSTRKKSLIHSKTHWAAHAQKKKNHRNVPFEPFYVSSMEAPYSLYLLSFMTLMAECWQPLFDVFLMGLSIELLLIYFISTIRGRCALDNRITISVGCFHFELLTWSQITNFNEQKNVCGYSIANQCELKKRTDIIYKFD